MHDFLDTLAEDAVRTIESGYYKIEKTPYTPSSLSDAIQRCKRAAIISELKFASPSHGILREEPSFQMVKDMERGGAVGISILTEPKHFGGCLEFVSEAQSIVSIPLLMKDIIISPVQLEAASRIGADAVLLIKALFDRGYCEEGVKSMVEYSHSLGLEVILEAHTEAEYVSSLKTDADMFGINNRDLKTLEVDLTVTKQILRGHREEGKVIISESGITSPEDVRLLRDFGVHAFLVGTNIMKAKNVIAKVRELVGAF